MRERLRGKLQASIGMAMRPEALEILLDQILEIIPAPGLGDAWKNRRKVNIPKPGENGSRVVGFVVREDEFDIPMGMINEWLEQILKGCAPKHFETVTVSAAALHSVLRAIDGPPHHIRELQVTRDNPPIFVGNPIDVLHTQFNEQFRAFQAGQAKPEKDR